MLAPSVKRLIPGIVSNKVTTRYAIQSSSRRAHAGDFVPHRRVGCHPSLEGLSSQRRGNIAQRTSPVRACILYSDHFRHHESVAKAVENFRKPDTVLEGERSSSEKDVGLGSLA